MCVIPVRKGKGDAMSCITRKEGKARLFNTVEIYRDEQ